MASQHLTPEGIFRWPVEKEHRFAGRVNAEWKLFQLLQAVTATKKNQMRSSYSAA